jgi:hypothetical protein
LKAVLFGAEAWDATEHRGHMVLSIPVRQRVDERCDGIYVRYMFHQHIPYLKSRCTKALTRVEVYVGI